MNKGWRGSVRTSMRTQAATYLRRLSVWPGGLCAALMSLVPATQGFAACSLEKYADLPVVMNGRQPTIEGSINGMPARFLADSGSFYSILWADRASHFNLRVDHPPGGYQIQKVDGVQDARVTTIKDFSLSGLGGNVLHNIRFLVAGQSSSPVDGIVGQNILGRADTEYDLGNGAVRLYHATGCENYSLAYWHGTAPVSQMQIAPTSDAEPQIIGSARLNGLKISVLFDTGAQYSMLSLGAARRAGFNPSQDAGTRPTLHAPAGPNDSQVWVTRFGDLDLGGEDIKHAQLQVREYGPLETDLVLGVDYFLSHHLYVAQSQHRIYFTYSGGRIFDWPDSVTGNADAGTAEAPSPDAAGGPPLDAAQYMRRGAASAARGELQHAILDFDAAIRLKPDDAESYYRRGKAKMQTHQYPDARQDFDEALKLQPENATWLNTRGVLRVLMKDDQGAAADFDTAAHLTPESENVDLEVADFLTQFGQFEAAVSRVDHWINTHPGNAELSTALNSRCWYRAMLGKELEKALADCDASLELKPHAAEVLDSRGLVYLRLGNYDKSIADYKAALRRSPREASSLYGLGLAQFRKGQQPDASNNMRQALTIDSETAERFRKFGVSP